MNPIASLIEGFRELVASVPDPVQPLVIALTAIVPFLEGEVGAMLGVVGGLHPVLAGFAAVVGNFLCVLAIVLLGDRFRLWIGARQAAKRATRSGRVDAAAEEDSAQPRRVSKGQSRARRNLERFGVPGASILGPLAMPTQFTAALLAATGSRRSWVLLWQAIAIVLWTSISAVGSWLAIHLVSSV
ncbi:small multidrug efflux protein [Arenivirga flava]|uniref:Small multidrug efflux protein n=1 Tax=Arenivirga flava TaxID=1930060 RepID=A0AA37UEH9_9MICO|nr:small multidrug efflux protein [Arenivirga flava]GMA28863.1 hypothetical protein GCM10025874_21160 [Arenivirga flava]